MDWVITKGLFFHVHEFVSGIWLVFNQGAVYGMDESVNNLVAFCLEIVDFLLFAI